ncbi:CoA transferase [Streptomyces sp. DSM 44915]|uniref:CoA transferase n=1 Tax=Streptomyces chisholmiae TaxID=3075540 RepID=A0ABU2JQ00_9ACTN|nr:CoA transferase [Streptomyces sp. DSM 44915]MDT0266599.1 CoA transferase [Streptomyces sp. DSM 44915]
MPSRLQRRPAAPAVRPAPAHRRVAERLLAGARDAAPGVEPRAVTALTDWAGPVDLPLSDERAVQAACGIMAVHGRPTGRPRPLAVEFTATVAGVLTAQGVCAALLARRRGLRVERVATSAAQGALLALGQYLAAATAPEDPEPAPGLGTATLRSADGVQVEVETLDPAAWREFWRRLGVPPALAGRGWGPFQQRFATGVCALPGELRAGARAHPLAVLARAAAATGVSLLPLSDDPDPAGRPDPVRLAPGPGAAPGPLPAAAGPLPLTGLRVVEVTRRVQGPLAGLVLALLGADVRRVEPPGGDPMRGLPPLAGGCSARFSALNAGKSVTEADLSTRDGRRTVRELATGADVFLHNWAPGRAGRLGLDAADLWPAAPGLVYAAASGFGDAFAPDPPPLGTDYLAQVHSGLAAALRPAGEPPAPSLLTLTDVLGGLLCAHGVLVGLLARADGGRGTRVDTSLVAAAGLVPRPRVRARWTPLDPPLATADGWLALTAADAAAPAPLARLAGAAGADPAAVAVAFRRRATKEWLDLLAEAGLTATPVLTDLAALPLDPAFRAAVSPPPPGGHARPLTPWTFS